MWDDPKLFCNNFYCPFESLSSDIRASYWQEPSAWQSQEASQCSFSVRWLWVVTYKPIQWGMWEEKKREKEREEGFSNLPPLPLHALEGNYILNFQLNLLCKPPPKRSVSANPCLASCLASCALTLLCLFCYTPSLDSQVTCYLYSYLAGPSCLFLPLVLLLWFSKQYWSEVKQSIFSWPHLPTVLPTSFVPCLSFEQLSWSTAVFPSHWPRSRPGLVKQSHPEPTRHVFHNFEATTSWNVTVMSKPLWYCRRLGNVKKLLF